MRNYFNTTRLHGEQLVLDISSAITQEEKIFEFFLMSKAPNLTPFEIQHELFEDTIPITSVRRALTCLTDKGKLKKTSHKRKGDYGKKCYCWAVNES